ncbi:MAG: hypothetical protein JWM85_3418, partial [Acidimicrobiaceae bacterium]|nr:hypothetical protein [Acidimicrobiaceae bacterium]
MLCPSIGTEELLGHLVFRSLAADLEAKG